jgi:hypothetical protein
MQKCPNPLLFTNCWLSIQIIYWNIKETLGEKGEIVKEIIILFW